MAEKKKLSEKIQQQVYKEKKIKKQINEHKASEYEKLETQARKRLKEKEGLITYKAMFYNAVVDIYKTMELIDACFELKQEIDKTA